MTPWDTATLALNLLAVDPQRLGGLVVRARVGPARDAIVAAAAQMARPMVKLNPHMSAQVLDGEVDLTTTLQTGSLVMQRGILDRDPSLLVLPMAERVDPYVAARLGQCLDAGPHHAILALDEGAEEAEGVPASLADRMALFVNLADIALADITPIALPTDMPDPACVTIPPAVIEELVVLAVSLGISSLRAPSFAAIVAQAHAAMSARDTVTMDDVSATVGLVYAHRATQMPAQDPPEPPPPEDNADQTPPPEQSDTVIPQDILLDAVKAALPADLLADLDAGVSRRATGSGSGAKRTGNRRGRPLPARQGPKSSTARVDLVATLRAAIPWQTLRKRAAPDRDGPIFQQTDLRHRRFETQSDRLLIFTVDASGSAAMARLAEAKGAVEILLSEAYARRDHVALIAFRGAQADVLLPPTRSLVQTKRRLAAIPGGGATPLASGLSAALDLSKTAAQKGLTPTIILLTDGRANIALDGTADRTQAAKDAQTMGAMICAAQIDTIVIDTTIRPERSLRQLAQIMQGTYIAMPRADAGRVSSAVAASMAD